MSTSTDSTALMTDPENARITRVVQEAADATFRARVRIALARVIDQHSLAVFAERLKAAGITNSRWRELTKARRAAASPAEFKAFARVLRVSPKWLVTGYGGYEAPPAGWHDFGTHVEEPDVQLEFSTRVGEDGMPKWERAVA